MPFRVLSFLLITITAALTTITSVTAISSTCTFWNSTAIPRPPLRLCALNATVTIGAWPPHNACALGVDETFLLPPGAPLARFVDHLTNQTVRDLRVWANGREVARALTPRSDDALGSVIVVNNDMLPIGNIPFFVRLRYVIERGITRFKVCRGDLNIFENKTRLESGHYGLARWAAGFDLAVDINGPVSVSFRMAQTVVPEATMTTLTVVGTPTPSPLPSPISREGLMVAAWKGGGFDARRNSSLDNGEIILYTASAAGIPPMRVVAFALVPRYTRRRVIGNKFCMQAPVRDCEEERRFVKWNVVEWGFILAYVTIGISLFLFVLWVTLLVWLSPRTKKPESRPIDLNIEGGVLENGMPKWALWSPGSGAMFAPAYPDEDM